MTAASHGSERSYEILVRGRLSDAIGQELGATRIEEGDAGTVIVIAIIDQAHLHGVLERLRDLNVEIESVNPCASEKKGTSNGAAAQG